MNKQDLIGKARADPSFLKLLKTQPAKALGVTKLTPENLKLVKEVIEQTNGKDL